MYSMEMNNLINCRNMEQVYFDLLSGPLLEDDDKDLLDSDLPFELPDPSVVFESEVACWVQQSPIWGKNVPDIKNSVEEEVEGDINWVSEIPGWIKEVPKIESSEEDEVDVVSVDDDTKSLQSTEPSTPTKTDTQPLPDKSPKNAAEGAPVVSSSLLDRMKAASAKKRSPILIQPPERSRPSKNDAATNTAPCPAATPDHDYCTAAKGGSRAENHSGKRDHAVVRPVSRSPSVTRSYRPQKRSVARRPSRSPRRRRRSRSSSPSSGSSSYGSSDDSVRRRSRSSRRSRDCHSSWRPQHCQKEPRRFMPSPPRRRIPDQKEERRVIYVGNIPEGTTRLALRERFARFGHIEEVSVHFRDHGDNYGFVTFLRGSDAYEAVEHGNDDPKLPRFDLCFGGRRQFCRTNWADLDSQYERYYYIQREPHVNNLDFDSLLQAAKSKIQGSQQY
ncbi:uncharacterized protein [Dermacentor andersoni]|uniref:uncharacterized protein n=1 Tax=Dermacentor andersoni TaxID=34620 RepID=UPI002155B444|nr:peroxisome proliferator-activated receptor gamma coactivator-related protein 1-like [Dermacentor andersoni]